MKERISLKKTIAFAIAFFMVDLKGFEPSTPTMRMWCAPNCATSPYSKFLCIIPLPLRIVKKKICNFLGHAGGRAL